MPIGILEQRPHQLCLRGHRLLIVASVMRGDGLEVIDHTVYGCDLRMVGPRGVKRPGIASDLKKCACDGSAAASSRRTTMAPRCGPYTLYKENK